MAKKTPSRKNLAIVLSAAFLTITLLMGVFAFLGRGLLPKKDKPTASDTSVTTSSETEISAPEESDPPETSDTPEESEPEPEPVFFNLPDEMRGVILSAGTDFLTGDQPLSTAALGAQLDKALADAKELTMNTVIIDTKYKDTVLFASDTLKTAGLDLDVTGYLSDKAREMGFYVYLTYDAADLMGEDGAYQRAADATGETLDAVMAGIGAFAEKYKPDGILLRDYENPANGNSYAGYLQSGGGIGYQNYLRQVPRALVTAATAAVREHAPGTQVGLLVRGVWENAATDAAGSETTAEKTAMGYGNADTKAFIEDGLADFVMVDNSGSTIDANAKFGAVAKWWSQVADQAGVPLYMLHASDRVGEQSAGWTVYEQLTKQIIDLREIGGASGSAFRSLKALNANPGNSTTTLVQYLNDQINEQWVLTQLAISSPQKMTFTTKEQSITFQGASDPQAEVTMNGEKIPTNESGYFAVREELKTGLNSFVFNHKGKTLTYQITRQVQVLKEVSPTGKLSVDGGVEVTVTALAYEDATVSASIGGQTITLSKTDNVGDEVNTNSGYQLFTGVFTAPSASASATLMGNITFTASAQGETQTMQGAQVTVNKKAVMGDGAVVYVVADEAETFPVNTLNDVSSARYFPLPKGTVDKTYGDEIVYKNGDVTKTYWNLESGVRVYAEDIKASGGAMPDQNEIESASVKSSGAYTTVTLNTAQKVPFRVEYDGAKIVFKFDYTAKAPEKVTLGSNALFSDAAWSGSNLTLTLKKAGGFLGYKASYEDNTLMLRFNNSPGSLSGARVVVDPGHGGNDVGALGFYPGKDEADINYAVAKKLASALKSQGASVLTVEPGSTMATRLTAARAFNPQVLVSLHCNSSASNPKAAGTEVYYFYPFSKQLAANVSANIAKALKTENRGAKAGLYYMTRESQFACVLAEMGFICNESEYTKLINSKVQTAIAQGIANGVSAYLGGTSAGKYDPAEEEDPDEEDPDKGNSGADGSGKVKLNQTTLELEKGESYQLKVSGGSGGKVKWKSEDSAIAAVSSSGKVTAKSKGTVYIIATSGGKTMECEVRVSGDSSGGKVTGITLDQTKITLYAGGTGQLRASIKPSNASNKTVEWTSDDEDVVTVDQNGRLEAIAEGEAWITAKAKDGGESVECKVTVKAADHSGGNIRDITISGESSLAVGTRILLNASIRPTNASDPGVRWSTSDNSIVALTKVKKKDGTDDEQSIRVEGLKNGTVTITAEAYDSGKERASFKLKVGNGAGGDSGKEESSSSEGTKPSKGVLMKSISISGPDRVAKGERGKYTATVSPANAEDPGIYWTISDSDLAILHRDSESEQICKVEGVHTGTVTLTARGYGENKKITKTFTIKITS